MAVAVGSTSTLAFGSRTNSTVTAPASISNGDVLVALVYAGDAGDLVAPAVTGPAGFTKYSGSPFTSYLAADNYAIGLNVFWKIASGESGSYTFTHGAASSQAIMYRLTGAHQTTPISPTPTSTAYIGNVPQVGKAATAPGLTTSGNGSLVIYAVGLWDGGPGTPPTGSTPTFTERLDSGAMYVADGVLTTAGATGDKVNASNFTAQSTTSPWIAMLIAVQPPTVNAYSLTADGGSYAVTGTNATTTLATPNKVTTASGSSYAIAGTAATLTKAGGGGALPVFRAVANSTYGASHTDTTIAKPTGTVDGDIMIAGIMAAQSDATVVVITPPAGWTQIGTTTLVTDGGGFDSRFWVYWKRASSEGSSYAFLHEGGSGIYSQGVISSYSGCLASGSPVDVFSQNSGTGLPGTTATATSVTTTSANTKLIYVGNNWDGTGLTPPTGMTERFDGIAYLADEDRVSTGVTSTRTQTLASNNPWQAYLIALKPTAGGVTAYTLTAAAGSYALTGTAATPVYASNNKVTTAVAGAYAIAGADAALTKVSGSTDPIAFRAEAHTTYAASDSTIVSKPTGTVEHDVLVAGIFYLRDGGATPTDLVPPSGWTQAGTTTAVSLAGANAKFSVWWKRAGSSEASTYSFDHWETPYNQGVILAYSGVIASGSPVDATSQASSNSGATATATSVTATMAQTRLVYLGHNWDGTGTLNPPTGMTERYDALVYAADEAVAIAGATGGRTQTLASAGAWAAFLIALKPAAFSTAYTIAAVAGSYAVTGTDATPVKVVPGGYETAAEEGAYALTGTPATLPRSIRKVIPDTGTYAIGGTQATPTHLIGGVPSTPFAPPPINPAVFLPFLVR